VGFSDPTHGGMDSVRGAAAEIFVHCFPLYLTDAVRRQHPISLSQFHLLSNDASLLAPGLFEDDPRVVISSAWVDLSSGPVVLRAPNVHGRHFSLTVIDTAGRCVVSAGSRTGDDGGLDLVLVGPRWVGEIRRGVRAQRSTSESCWVVSRIHAHSMLDRADTIALARRQSLAILYYETELREAAEAPLESLTSSCLQQVLEMAPDQFFQRLAPVLARCPTAMHGAEQAIMARLKPHIGEPGKDSASWKPELVDELAAGFADGVAEIRAAAGAVYGVQGEGWRILAAPSDTETPLARAARVYEGLGGPSREDRLTFICERDDTGRILTGGNTYRISLPPDAMPPVNAFWRLYTRPAAGAQYRTGIGSRNDLLLNEDGSLELTIQHPLPEVAGIANWLPAPEGELALVMCLHSPRPAALKGAWRLPAVERLDPGSRHRRSRARRPTTTRGTLAPELRAPLPSERNETMKPLILAARLALGVLLATSAHHAVLAQTAAPAAAESSVDPEAKAALDRMAGYLRTLTSFEVTTQTTLDLVTNDGQRIELDGTGAYKVRRPNSFVISIETDEKKRRFIYDGKQFTVYAPKLGYYASASAPPTIAATLDLVADKYGIVLPIEDLFRWNDPSQRTGPLDSAMYVGAATIDGTPTEQYAFRQGKVDWQVWIQTGDKPLPRKLVIVDRSDPAEPGYSARLTWKTNPTFTNEDFAFRPDKDAKAIRLSALSDRR
jgi:hypothetical protein